MSTLTLGYMVDLVEKKAQDEGNADFDVSELVGLYNMTLRLICSLVPRAYTLTESWQMVSGSLQAIPSNGIKLVDILKNMGTDGLTEGNGISLVDHEAMRKLVPNWSSETAAQEIQHYMRLADMDARFYVYPPSDGTGYIQGIFSATPPTVVYDVAGVWQNARIPLSDEFVPAIPDGMLFHAYDDDTDVPGTATRAQIYYGRFTQLLGLKSPEVRGLA